MSTWGGTKAGQVHFTIKAYEGDPHMVTLARNMAPTTLTTLTRYN